MDPDKLAKVLALAESDHQGEALSALRAARIMLSRAGMTFKDLAAGARPVPRPEPPPPPEPSPPATAPSLDLLIQALRRQVSDLERELSGLQRQFDKVTTDADRQREEADRWRTLARETAEKLWDMGKALERRHSRNTRDGKRRAVLELLQDPHSALLSDHEIARRIGTAPSTVAQVRRRLAIVGRKMRLLPVQQRGRGLYLGRSRRAVAFDAPRQRWAGFPAALTIAGNPGYGASR